MVKHTYLQQLAMSACMLLGWPVNASPTKSGFSALESRATGFQLIANKQLLQDSTLSSTCQQVLQQTIGCDDYVAGLGDKTYHGSLGDPTLTNSVCTATCERALVTTRRRISGACASTPDIIPGYPVISLIESVITGWNETCLKDTATGKYCNDIIDSWEDYDEIEQMPDNQLCSYCYGAKLRMMQQSAYSAYDGLFAKMLQRVNTKCKIDSPTTTLPEPIQVNVTQPMDCGSKKMYTARDGDTCDSIALANSISAATLYYQNPNLTNCSSIAAGLSLCLPEKCQTLYQVESKDEDCVLVGVNAGTSWVNLVSWNLALDSRCSNLWSTTPFWGRVICVSPPGGDFIDPGTGGNGNVGNGDIGGEGGSGDGYADAIVDAPRGTVAKGTTANCGRYVQAKPGVGCPSMLAKQAVPMNLFLKANPSLGTVAECDGKLVSGVWYCLHPVRYWDDVKKQQ